MIAWLRLCGALLAGASAARAQLSDFGDRSPAFTNTLAGAAQVAVGDVQYDHCKSVVLPDGEVVQLRYSERAQTVLMNAAVARTAVGPTGYLAIARVADREANSMRGSTVVIGQTSGAAEGGLMGAATFASDNVRSPPEYDADPAVSNAQVGVTADQQVFSMTFERDDWAGADKALVVSYRNTGAGGAAPAGGATFDGGNHGGMRRVRLPSFDFTAVSVCAPPRPIELQGVALDAAVLDKCALNKVGVRSLPLGDTGRAVTLRWTHDCEEQTTKFVVEGTLPGAVGWVAVGLKNGALESEKMGGVDFYMFNTLMETQDGYLPPDLADNQVPQEVPAQQRFVLDGVVVATVDGVTQLTGTFERKWDADDDKHAQLAAAAPLSLLVAVGPSTSFLRQHNSADRASSDGDLELFDAPAPTPPLTPAPTPGNDPPPAGDNPCGADPDGSFENDFAVKKGDFVCKISYKIDCKKEEIEMTFEADGTADGWLAIGFNAKKGEMDNTDVYQAWGDKLRNGRTKGRASVERAKADTYDGATVETVGGALKATFTRTFVGVDDQEPLSAAKPVWLNVAWHPDADPDTAHQGRMQSGTDEAVAAKLQLFTEGDVFGGDAAPSGGPCESSDSFKNSLKDLPLDVTLDYEINCKDETITMTLKGESEGWLAIGFNDKKTMIGADIYQVVFDDDEGDVRNVRADGRSGLVKDGAELSDVDVEKDGNEITATFTRSLAGADDDFAFEFGKPLFVLAADGGDDPDEKHDDRGVTPEKVDLFVEDGSVDPDSDGGEGGANPCDTDDEFANAVELTLPSTTVNIAYKVDCVNKFIEFTVSGTTDGWLAFGLNADPQMGGADVYQLHGDQDDIKVRNAHANERVGLVDDNQGYIEVLETSREGGVISATFKRPLEGSEDGFDATIAFEEPLHLLVAVKSDGEIDSQHDERFVGGDAVDLYLGGDVGGGVLNVMYLIHGILMMSAWGAASIVGTFFARYLKGLGHSWFLIHRGIMYGVVAATVIGFIVILVETGGTFNILHHFLGLIIVIFTLAQPVLGVLADKWWSPDREGTPIFPDTIHWWLGRSLLLLGFVNCVLGIFVFHNRSEVIATPAIIIVALLGVLLAAYFLAGQLKIGSAHHNADSDDSDAKADPVTWRNISFGVLALGFVLGIVAVIVAESSFVDPL